MPTFFRGAGIGTYWHQNDARASGFTAHFPGAKRNTASLMDHIRNGTTASPYISLTRSYSVAWTYAFYSGHEAPTRPMPAYVYVVEIDNPPPVGLTVMDPICDIAKSVSDPLSHFSYQHNGFPDFLMGVVDPRTMGTNLAKVIKQPPPSGAAPRPATLTEELETLVRALRDAEILAVGTIPATCVVRRYEIY